MLFFAAMSHMHLWYAPSACDTTHTAYSAILTPSFRLFTSSISVFLLTQNLDIRLFKLLKDKIPALPFAVRSGLSTTCTQLVDTVLFSLLGLWGLVSSIGEIICISFLIKCIIISLLTPLIACIKRIVPVKV
jgi:uncharacterized integral membrane protein (TIGR00697 family)